MKITRVEGKNPLAESFAKNTPTEEVRGDLSPCPFCGNDEIYFNEDQEIIICFRCSIEIFKYFSGAGDGESVIKVWNTRK